MRKFRKLNRKGFTLIELLAVIVILAVIMVIASGSVLSSMNESKKKSLLNSADVAANEFTTNFSEQTLLGSTVLFGIEGLMEGTSTTAAVKDITETAGKTYLDISENDYDFTTTTGSFVSYNGTKFLVCFVANPSGSFYVAAAKSTKAYTPAGGRELKTGLMWACSDGSTSWKEGQAS